VKIGSLALPLMLAFLALPGLAWGQGVRVDNPGGPATRNVQNFLAPIPGATITICQAGATGAPCSPLVPTSPVTLCTDATCSTAAPNPFTADAGGNFGGWLLPGTYTFSITGTGVTGKIFNLTIPPTLPVNLATQVTGTIPGANMSAVNLATSGNGGVTGTLPGANYAAVNLAAGNVNGGATGTLPAANLPATTGQCTGVQFSRGQAAGGTENCATPPTFVASGASHAVGYVPDPGSSAGTTRFLREDATWVAPSNSSAVFVGGCNGTASAGSTLTLFGLGNFTALTCTQSGVAGSIPMPSAGTLKNLRVVAVTAGVNASSGVVTVMDNGVSTGITCTLGTGTTCNDTTHTASVAAGDLILIQFTTQGAETLAGVRATVEKQ
jgi:hypothetical protein